MSDLSVVAGTSLKSVFSKTATSHEKNLEDAQKFIEAATAGTVDVEKGKDLLNRVEKSTIVYSSSAAFLAGRDSSSDAEIDNKIAAIEKNIETAEKITARLKKVLTPAA